jgi:pimeloyl-ACP methyl ester carboxylesterase
VKKTVQLSRGSIAYSEDGHGPPVVLLHGLLVSGSLWRDVVRELAKDARVIVPELPLGSHTTPMDADADLSIASIAKLVSELMDRLDLEDVTLAGSDTGGAIAQVVATEHGERVGRLVLTSCDAFEDFPPKLFKPLLAAAKIPGALTVLGLAFRIKPLLRSPLGFGWLSKRGIDDARLDEWTAPGRRPEIRRDVTKVMKSVDPAITQRAAEKLERFDKPVLIAWAADDRAFPVELAHRLVAAVPDGRLELIPDSYAFTPVDQPHALASHIASFVREPAPAAT